MEDDLVKFRQVLSNVYVHAISCGITSLITWWIIFMYRLSDRERTEAADFLLFACLIGPAFSTSLGSLFYTYNVVLVTFFMFILNFFIGLMMMMLYLSPEEEEEEGSEVVSGEQEKKLKKE